MRTPPQPKAEVAASRLNPNRRSIQIFVASADALTWVEEKCSVFGAFFFPRIVGGAGFMLDVSDLYDVNEVVAYINSYGQEDES